MLLIREPVKIRNLAEWQDIPDGSVPACQRCLRYVNDIITMNGETTRGNYTSGISKVKTIDIGGVGWSFSENKDAAEVGAILSEATTRTYKVI